jgi:hypothetical protein
VGNNAAWKAGPGQPFAVVALAITLSLVL